MTEQSAGRTPRADARPDPAPSSGRKVLVVDDDIVWLADLKGWLEDENLQVTAVSRGEWIPEAVDLHRPSVVVLDLHLPGVDGLDVLQQLQRRWPGLPVIVMTAFGGSAVERRVRELGAMGYFGKPFRVGDLVAEIRRLAPENA